MFLSAAAAEESVLETAVEARLILRCTAGAAGLEDLRIGPRIVPGAVIDARDEAGVWTADVRFPVQWWRWSSVEVAFTASSGGEVELALTGPWADLTDGCEVRQEILWDSITADGCALENGGFEQPGAGAPAGWDSPWRPYPDAGSWPLAGAPADAGKHCAAAWHGRPLTQSLRVRTGEKIRITLNARAATTPDSRPPPDLGADTPAHRACKRLSRGVNLGNCWESSPGEAGVRFLPQDIDHIAAQGFDHIRVPVAWHQRIDGNGISSGLLGELEPVLRHALQRGLTVLLVWQNHGELSKDPQRHRLSFVTGWRTLATHFQSWPPGLFFDLLNEPSGNLTGETLNRLYAATIAAIRESNPRRTLVVEPGQWSTVTGLDRLRLPDGETNLIVSIHCYEPFPITHQGASWVGLENLRGLVFPGPPPAAPALSEIPRDHPGLAAWIDAYHRRPAAENPASALAFQPILAQAAEWSASFGRPLHIGEFGATRELDPASRAAYALTFRRAAASHRLPWCWWEWKAGFGCWDAATGQPLLHEALSGR
ncbi:MAG: cellulase family glycosylhydrolase [Luteolibacter sp.]|nr:cellulase family glycosylhydrolase [Luteolibacter sp.]